MERFSVKEFMKLKIDLKFLLIGNALTVAGVAFCSMGNLLKLLNSGANLPSPNLGTHSEIVIEPQKNKTSFWDK